MGTAVVLVDTATACPACDAPSVELAWEERALFRHGGYGATRRTTLRHCASFCGWWIRGTTTETSPRVTVRR